MLLTTFADRVRFLRRAWGLSQSAIYKEGGPGRTTLFRIESGDSSPDDLSENTLNGLSIALKCHRHWLETGIGKVWLDGVIPPQGSEEIETQNHSPKKINRPDPELGRYITDGPTDWAIVVQTIRTVDRVVADWSGAGAADLDVDYAEAYRLVYKYLSKRKDPFSPIPYPDLSVLLSII